MFEQMEQRNSTIKRSLFSGKIN